MEREGEGVGFVGALTALGSDLWFGFDFELAFGVVSECEGSQLRNQFGVVGDGDFAIGEAFTQLVEDLGAHVDVFLGFVGVVSAAEIFRVVHTFPFQIFEDTGAVSDRVDEEVAHVVFLGGGDDAADGSGEIGSTDLLEVEDSLSLADDDYGFVVAEPGDVDSHDWFFVRLVFGLAFDGGFDVV